MFYTPSEQTAIAAFWRHTVSQRIWTGPDDRLLNVVQNATTFRAHGSQIDGFALHSHDQFLLYSPQLAANLKAQNHRFPNYTHDDKILTAGSACIFTSS
jgi:hypothetical protein